VEQKGKMFNVGFRKVLKETGLTNSKEGRQRGAMGELCKSNEAHPEPAVVFWQAQPRKGKWCLGGSHGRTRVQEQEDLTKRNALKNQARKKERRQG